MNGWANYFRLGQVSPAYEAIDAHAIKRLRQWLCGKHKVRAGKYVRFCSWSLTGRCMMRMIGMLVLTLVLVYALLFAGAVVIGIAVAIGIGLEGGTWSEGLQEGIIVTTVETSLQVGGLIGSFVIAIVWSVCYYYLRAAEDEPNESA